MKNQKMKAVAFSVIAGMGLAFSHQASAAVVYSYIAQSHHYSGNPGDVIAVNVYLQEQLTASSDVPFLATEGGLSGFGVVATQSPTGLPSSPSFLSAPISDAVDFGGFKSNSPPDAAGDTATIAASINLGASGVQVNNGGANVAISNAVFLGTFSVTVAPGTTTFTLGAVDPVNGANTVTKNGSDLDIQQDPFGGPSTAFIGVGSGTTTFDVTAAPEPASLGVLAMGGLLVLRRRRA
jgi:MYXO-CTERM domain-containing protein